MFPLPNFDDPVIDEVRREPGAKSKGERKRHTSKLVKRGKASKRTGVGTLKRTRSSR